VVALLLRPRSSELALSGLATTGPGVLGTTIRKTRSNAVGVVRNGRKLIFFVGGPGFGNVGEIVVKAFVKQPKARKLQTAKPVSASWWELIDRDLAAAESALPAPGGATSCEELKAMRQTVEQQLRIAADRAALLQKTKREIASELGDLGAAGTSWFLVKEAFLHSVGAPIGVLLGKGTLPEVAADRHRLKKTLELDAKLVDAALERNAALIAKLEGLAEDIDLLISDCRDPWLQLSQVRAEFDQASFTTTYTVTASILNAPADDVVTYEWSVSIPADQKCAEGFRGGYPKPNQATWYHADKSEGGPCGHTGTESGPRGHPGTVTVTAADRFWICRNSYLGTQGDNGATSGVQGIPSCDVR
jgi:hypothetical protein